MPVDLVSLCAWACLLGETVKPKTVSKYASGARFAHLINGHLWPFNDEPLFKMTMAALRRRYPEDNTMKKVPLTLELILLFCRAMPGWPDLAALSFDDLVWATAAACAFFAALRGGEFFRYPNNDRPMLMEADMTVVVDEVVRYLKIYLKIMINAPKSRPWVRSEPAFAASPGPDHELDVVRLYTFMVSERARLFGRNGDGSVRTRWPAFARSDGSAIDRAFMVGRANELRAAAAVDIFDTEGNSIDISAASWRAGYVQSARRAHIDPLTIRAVGRWASSSGPLPYSFDSTGSIQDAAREIVLTGQDIGGLRTSSFAGGRFATSSIVEL